jgi:hypothetical protein
LDGHFQCFDNCEETFSAPLSLKRTVSVDLSLLQLTSIVLYMIRV